MANTLPDLQLVAGVWTEVYSATGITSGQPLIIQNKITAPFLIQVRATTPVTTTDGYSVASNATVYLDGTLSGVWIRCTSAGRVVIMVNDGEQ